MREYAHTLGSLVYRFRDLKDLLAKATPLRSGDMLAGVAAAGAQERVAAQMALADLPLTVFLNEALVPYESDEVTRLIIDTHDRAAFAAIAHLARRREHGAVSGAFNFCAPEAIEQRRFAQVAGTVLHRPSIMPTPAFVMRALLGEQADLLVEGQRVAPRRLLADGFVFRHPQLEGALRSL